MTALVLLLAGAVLADPVVTHEQQRTILAQEIARHQQQIELPNAPPLYHLRYQLLDFRQSQARATSFLASFSLLKFH